MAPKDNHHLFIINNTNLRPDTSHPKELKGRIEMAPKDNHHLFIINTNLRPDISHPKEPKGRIEMAPNIVILQYFTITTTGLK